MLYYSNKYFIKIFLNQTKVLTLLESLTKILRLVLELAVAVEDLAVGELTAKAAVLEVAVVVLARELEAAVTGLVKKFIIFSKVDN